MMIPVWGFIAAPFLIALLCKLSLRFRYYVRYIVFMIYTFIGSFIFVPFMLFRPRDSRNGLMPAWVVRFCSRVILGVTFEIRGQENILPEGQGCVIVVNHQSALDLIVTTYIWPYIPNGYTVVKREVFWVYPIPWLWNTVFINRLNPERAMNDINKVGSIITTKQARLCMFPEGTRHMGDKLLPFKKGAFNVAQVAQCPIQPVVVSKYHFLDHNTHKFNGGHNIIEFLPAIPTAGLTRDQIPELIEKTKLVMQENFTRLSEESLNLNTKRTTTK